MTDQLGPRLPSGRAKLSLAVCAVTPCCMGGGSGGSDVLAVESDPQPAATKMTKAESRKWQKEKRMNCASLRHTALKEGDSADIDSSEWRADGAPTPGAQLTITM